MPTSIFTDDTGRRSQRVRWTVRAISATLVIGVGAIVLSLFTHVSMPGLGLPDPVVGRNDASVKKPEASHVPSPATTTPANTTSPASADDRQTPVRETTASEVATKPTAATPLPTSTPSHSTGKAADAPRAAPTHAPATPPATPPGKSK